MKVLVVINIIAAGFSIICCIFSWIAVQRQRRWQQITEDVPKFSVSVNPQDASKSSSTS